MCVCVCVFSRISKQKHKFLCFQNTDRISLNKKNKKKTKQMNGIPFEPDTTLAYNKYGEVYEFDIHFGTHQFHHVI